MANILKLKQAREAAWAGRIDQAVPALERFAVAGAASAWAMLAQIRGYRGDWNGALDAATHLLADPNDIHAGNVTIEAKWLLLRAGHETGRWVDVAKAIKGQQPLADGWTDIIGKKVTQQARAKGKLADPAFVSDDDSDDKRALSVRQRSYDEALAECEASWKKKKPKAGEREQTAWSYATAYRLDALALTLWPKAERYLYWDAAVHVARLLIAKKRGKEAVAVLEKKIANFWPVDVGQAAPIEPLVDETLRPFMTPPVLQRLLGTAKVKAP